jgi:hypothetical protein
MTPGDFVDEHKFAGAIKPRWPQMGEVAAEFSDVARRTAVATTAPLNARRAAAHLQAETRD